MASSTPKPPVVIWLHGLGGSGPASEGVKEVFTKSYMSGAKWLFPSAPVQPVSVNNGAHSPSWFDFSEPLSAQPPEFEDSVLKAVGSVHAMIDEEVKAGTPPEKIFVCGFSQGGALSLASAMLYPEGLGGAAVIGGWVPLQPGFAKRISAKAKSTPVLWMHGMRDQVVKFSEGQAGPPLLEQAGVQCEFKAYLRLFHALSNEELLYLEEWFGSRLQNSPLA